MVAYETYANALITKGYGHPLWEPDPGEFAPVDIGDVGYLEKGTFIKLFNASKDEGNWSNRLGLPRGHSPLPVGDIIRKTPLPKAPEYISSEGVRKQGAALNVTTGLSGTAGGGFRFECSHQQGALLIMGDVAYREDASNQKEFVEYIMKHHRSWLDFAHVLGRDLSLSDLILVDGCDKTSEWACAAWSEKTSDMELNFVAGVPGIAEGSACLWGRWDSSESLDRNVGPQALIPPLTSEADTIRGSLLPLSDTLSNDNISQMQPMPPLSPSVPPVFNQCVFVRGFQMADRTTWFTRKKARIDVGRGFKTVRKRLDPLKKDNNNLANRNGSRQQSSSSDGGQSSHNTTVRVGAESVPFGSRGVSDLETQQDSDEEPDMAGPDINQTNSPTEALVDYIFKNSIAHFALVHHGDITDLLEISLDMSYLSIHDYDKWVQQLAPRVFLNGEVGMFSGVYNLQKSLGDLFNQNLLPGEDTYVKDISPIFSLGDKEQLDLQGDMNRDDKGTKERGGHGNEIEYHFSATELVPKWSSSSLPESLPPEISGGEEQWQPGYGGAIDYCLILNNYLEDQSRKQNTPSWVNRKLGPEHQSLWEATVVINHVEYGRGTAVSLDLAEEEAAYQALVALKGNILYQGLFESPTLP